MICNKLLALLVCSAVPMGLMASCAGGERHFEPQRGSVVSADVRQAAGHSYLVLTAEPEASVEYSVTRPDGDDPDVCLAVAAAFTGDDLVSICGDHVVQGKRMRGYDDVTATGHMLLTGGKVAIRSNGRLNESVNKAEEDRGSLFQQCLVVEGGKTHAERIPQAITDRKAHIIFRAACIMADGTFAVVQGADCQYGHEFVDGLVALGAKDAVYLDMGSWAYGWYRADRGGKAVELADHFANTAHQSNWLVVRARK